MIAGLPYDAEVEYLQSTGTQWIDTGKYITIDTKVETECAVMTTWLNVALFGASNGSSLTSGEISLNTDANRFFICLPTGPSSSTYLGVKSPYDQNTFYGIVYDRSHVEIGGTATGITWNANYVPSRTAYIFASNRGGAEAKTQAKVKYFRMTTNGVVDVDLIPVRFTNSNGQSEGAMYDRVSRKLFRNAGTGAFTIGPDVATPVMGLHFMPKPVLSARSYVQDGLVAMWDGIENAGRGVHDAMATTWKDIAGADNTGANDLIIASDNTWGEKWLNKINLTQSSVYNTTTITGVKTLEFVIGIDSPISTSWAYPFTLGAPVNDAENRTVQLMARGVNSIQGRFGQDGFSLPELTNTSPTIIAAQFTYGSDNLVNLCMVNGTQRASVGRRDQAGGYTGGVNLVYNASYQNTQRYYTIRVYNRALTAAEVAHNYAVDKERFNLP